MAKQFLSAISCYPGLVGAPGLYLGSDTTTGIYRIGANNLGVTVSGSKVLDISSTGLGITGSISSTTTLVSSGVEGTLIRAYTGSNYGAIYNGNVTPSNTNYVIAHNATTSYLNATSNVYININGATVGAVSSTGLGVTGSISSTGTVTGSNLSGTNTGDSAANSSTHYIGTTAIALNRASASQALTGITSIDGSSATTYRVFSTDLRSTTLTPSYFGMGVNFAFMQNTTDGLGDGGTYHTIMQVQNWSDSSGGGANELAFTDNNNLWIRGSSGALTTWSDWKKVLVSNPTTKVAGTFDTTATAPTNTTRLNYDGYMYATRFYGDGSQLTGVTTTPSADVLAFAAAYG